jgi:hypothetical protein
MKGISTMAPAIAIEAVNAEKRGSHEGSSDDGGTTREGSIRNHPNDFLFETLFTSNIAAGRNKYVNSKLKVIPREAIRPNS